MPGSSRYFDDPDDEDALFARLASRRRQMDYARSSATPELAGRASRLAGAYPWVPAGVTWSLASADIDIDDEIAKATARMAAKKKSKSGLGWHTIGEVVSAVGGAASKVSDVGSTVGEYVGLDAVRDFAGYGVREVKPVARGAFTALAAPFEQAQATISEQTRGVGKFVGRPVAEGDASALDPNTTHLGAAIQNRLQGEDVDLGEGFFPGGEIGRERNRHLRDIASIDGKFATPGKILAYTVSEPGTKPYNVLSGLTDAALVSYADPANIALSKVSAARKAGKLIRPEDVGLVAGRRKTVLPEVANEWLTSGDGQKVVDWLAGERSFDRAWKTLGKKVDVATVVRLVDATTPDEVRGILRPELGVTIREKPKVTAGVVGGLGVGVKRKLESVRLLQQMPGDKIDVTDIDQAVETLDLYQKNAKFSAEAIAANNEALARTTSRSEMLEVAKDVMRQTADELVKRGKPRSQARRATTMFQDSLEDSRLFFIDEIGENAWGKAVVVDGVEQTLPSPHLVVETLQRAIPLPDAREIRKATSRLHSVFESGVARVTESALDGIMQSAWKRWVLLRPAWTVRVVGEEQVRMAASGLDSAFAHPLSYIAWAVGDKNTFGRALGKLGMKTGRGQTGLTGEAFDDGAVIAENASEFQRAMSRRWGGYLADADVVRFKGKHRYRRGEEFYPRAWASEIMELASDPVARRVAGGWADGDRVPGGLTGNHVEDAKRWFWDGPGSKFRKQDLVPVDERLLTREFSDRYIDSVFRRLSIKTADDSDLIAAVATGKLGDDTIVDSLGVSKKLLDRLTSMADDDLGPQLAKGDLMAHAKQGPASKALAAYDRTTTHMFTFLMGRPTNYLSRSPAFRQFYWQRAEELLPFMDEASRATALTAARDAGLSRQTLRKMAKRVVDRPPGTLTFEDADEVAKGFGLDSTRELLYDLSNRSQFGDVTRLIFPFADAWIELMTRWAKLGVDNPQIARRAQLTIEGARGSGFFYTDDNGQEVFAYPATGWLTEQLVGVPAPLTGTVKGLSIATSLLPGFGPVVQIPASQLIPAKPSWDEVRNMILPYGDVDTGRGLVETLFPGWVKKVMTAIFADPESDKMLGSTMIQTTAWLRSTGEYSTNSEEDLRRLLDDAELKARVLLVVRATGQAVGPSAPSFEFLAKDKEGRSVTAQRLGQEFRKLEQADYDTAVDKFLTMFGEDAVLYMQGKTRSLIPAAPVTAEASKWARAHPEIVEKFPHVYGLFAPQGDKLDLSAYTRAIDAGEIEPLTPEQALRSSNATLGRWAYNQAKKRLNGATDRESMAWLRTIRNGLEDLFPGFNDEIGLTGKKKTPELIEELERAVKHRDLAKTEVGLSIKVYLAARSKAIEDAVADGLSPGGLGTAKRARYLRDWLRETADRITAVAPGFALVYERLFEREFTADDVEEEEAA